MRILLRVLILAILVAPVVAQGHPGALDPKMQQKAQLEKAQAVLRELAQFEYKAKMDVPESDNLFVEDGKVVLPMYNAALKSGKTAVKAGGVVKVSAVQFMDFAVQVSFSNDSFTIFGTSSTHPDISKLSAADLTAMAKTAVAAMFEAIKIEATKTEK